MPRCTAVYVCEYLGGRAESHQQIFGLALAVLVSMAETATAPAAAAAAARGMSRLVHICRMCIALSVGQVTVDK